LIHHSATESFLVALTLFTSLAISAQTNPTTLRPERFAAPPGAETATVRKLIEEAEAMIEKGMSTSEILSNPKWIPAHPWPRFRDAIRRSARAEPLTIVSSAEAGTALVIKGRLLDAAGVGIDGAMLYVYQTDARGLYADNAIHIGGDSGDWKHARLFGYLKSGKDGEWELRTIRPAGYPNGELPQHIHVEILHGKSRLTTEIGFDDDPRLTPAWRARYRSEGNIVAAVRHTTVGPLTAGIEIILR